MHRIEDTDNRKQAIEKFDSCMERFFDSSGIFLEELKKIPCCDENSVKMYSLAMNYYHDTNLVIDIATHYYDYIAYSMLSVNHTKHDKLYRRFCNETYELTHRLKSILELTEIELDYTFPSENPLDEQLAEMDKTITGQFDENGILYFGAILKNLSKIKDVLKSLEVVGGGRTANSYEEIYDRMREEYYNSDLWENLKNNYISDLIKRKFRNRSITTEAIEDLICELEDELESHEELGAIWQAFKNNKTKLSKEIVNKEYESPQHIEFMFSILGKKELLENWKEEIRFEELPCEIVEEETGLVQGVEFFDEPEEQRFHEAWPEIYSYMKEVKVADYAWCCLHHILTSYHFIKTTSFKFFMRWLNHYANEQLITEVNIRQASFHYFVNVVETKWSLKDMEEFYRQGGKQKITLQLKKKYEKYSRICIELRDILREH